MIPRSLGGDDCEDNIVTLCGTGTTGCHGAFHGSPYEDEHGTRWTQEDVCRAIGRHLRPRHVRYVLRKLGESAGADYLRRIYHREELWATATDPV